MVKLRLPAAWEPREAVWMSWPASPWLGDLAAARREAADFITAIARPDPDHAALAGETVHLFAAAGEPLQSAQAFLADLMALGRVKHVPMESPAPWLGDSGLLWAAKGGPLHGVQFGAGSACAEVIARAQGLKPARHALNLPSGALDTDGMGTILASRSALLGKDINPGTSDKDVEKALTASLGAAKVLWLEKGLLNDPRRGSATNIARFLAPGIVGVMRPTGDDDPNAALFKEVYRTLSRASDANGQRLEVIELPSPGLVLGKGGASLPASHIGFCVSNHSLIVPVFSETDEGDEIADEAVDIIAEVAGRDNLYAITASHLLAAGGSFHDLVLPVPAY